VTRNVTWDRGVSLPEHAIWFDPEVSRALAVVTHAHTDHSRRHRETYLTAETLALTAARRRPKSARVIPFDSGQAVGGGTLTLLTAGHMLGSAQLLFEHQGASVLYTGDIKLRQPGGMPPTHIPKAQVLVLESTYGRPHFRFGDPD
jgi:Cft2 family RNA processing exonuclease